MTTADRIRQLNDYELSIEIGFLVAEAFKQSGISFKDVTYEQLISDIADDIYPWLKEEYTVSWMQRIVKILKKRIKDIDGTIYTGVYKEGYIDGLKDAIELIEKNIPNLLLVGATYYIIMYQNDNKQMPYVIPMKLCRIKEAKSRNKYFFTKDLDAENYSFLQADVIFESPTEIRKRIFLSKETAEAFCKWEGGNNGYL